MEGITELLTRALIIIICSIIITIRVSPKNSSYHGNQGSDTIPGYDFAQNLIQPFLHSNDASDERFTCINPLVMNGLSHPYQMDEYIFIFRGIRSNYSFIFHFYVSKQKSPRLDAAICGVLSGAILFAYLP